MAPKKPPKKPEKNPSVEPSIEPSVEPSVVPSVEPSVVPSVEVSVQPLGSDDVVPNDKTPRTIKQMPPNVRLFSAEPGGRPEDEIYVPFALARVTQDGKGDTEPRPADVIVPPEGVLREG